MDILRWTRLTKYCELSGDTRDGVNNRVRSGHWLKGVHLRRPDGGKELWVNLDAVTTMRQGRSRRILTGTGQSDGLSTQVDLNGRILAPNDQSQ